MATQQSTIDFLLDQLRDIPSIRARKMFGEYALYCNDKVVALVCDDNVYVKPTPASEPFMEFCELAPPYPKAKDYLKVSGEKWDDAEWLCAFITQTPQHIPAKKK